MDKFDELIIRARPAAPSHEGVLAAVAARPISEGVGAASRLWRAAALIALAAGVGALAAWLPSRGVGSPAAGDVSIEVATLDLSVSLEPRLEALNTRLDAVESAMIDARREQVRVALLAAVREYSADKKQRERQRRIERHVAQVRLEYADKMDEQLVDLKAEGLTEAQLERARAILEQHGLQAQELVRNSYNGGDRRLGDKFALLARETEDRLGRATGRDQWQDVLGAGTGYWAPTAELEDWSDFDNLMDWMRHSRS